MKIKNILITFFLGALMLTTVYAEVIPWTYNEKSPDDSASNRFAILLEDGVSGASGKIFFGNQKITLDRPKWLLETEGYDSCAVAVKYYIIYPSVGRFFEHQEPFFYCYQGFNLYGDKNNLYSVGSYYRLSDGDGNLVNNKIHGGLLGFSRCYGSKLMEIKQPIGQYMGTYNKGFIIKDSKGKQCHNFSFRIEKYFFVTTDALVDHYGLARHGYLYGDWDKISNSWNTFIGNIKYNDFVLNIQWNTDKLPNVNFEPICRGMI